ncbi:MAG TPA: hypothetical protein VMB34_29950 [Acetobacteraceae bacterium]|nr:hypothetical protein [Acetobacteraceae bacterium]
MSKPVASYAKEVLKRGNRGALLRAAMLGGWDSLKVQQPDRAWWRRKSTRAAVVWEYSVNNAIDALKDDKGVRVVSHYDTISLVIEDGLLVRLKKADIELRSRNVQTILASLFHHHDADLFGYQGLQRVEAAYVLNRFETEMDWVGIVARDGEHHLWHFELNELLDSDVVKLPLVGGGKPAAERLANLKTDDAEQQREQEND